MEGCTSYKRMKTIPRKKESMQDSNSQLRERISLLTSWSEVVYKKLASLPDNRLTHNKWLNLIAEYYLDIMNGDGSSDVSDSVARTLILRTIKKTGSSYNIIRDIFEGARSAPSKILSIKTDQNIRSKYPKVHSSDIEALALRYHLVLRSGGHFLSMDTELYQQLFLSSRLPVLECYASPYNNNLKDYCSLFLEDRIFGARPRFDEFIDTINFPCRLIANPPYTVSSLTTCIDKIVRYMRRQNGEFIALLPYMHCFSKMDELLDLDGTANVLLQGGTYLLHDFLTKTDIIAPMLLYIVVNVEGCKIKSAQMASNIAYRLRVRAEKKLNENE